MNLVSNQFSDLIEKSVSQSTDLNLNLQETGIVIHAGRATAAAPKRHTPHFDRSKRLDFKTRNNHACHHFSSSDI
jgi:hypothetical protein